MKKKDFDVSACFQAKGGSWSCCKCIENDLLCDRCVLLHDYFDSYRQSRRSRRSSVQDKAFQDSSCGSPLPSSLRLPAASSGWGGWSSPYSPASVTEAEEGAAGREGGGREGGRELHIHFHGNPCSVFPYYSGGCLREGSGSSGLSTPKFSGNIHRHAFLAS